MMSNIEKLALLNELTWAKLFVVDRWKQPINMNPDGFDWMRVRDALGAETGAYDPGSALGSNGGFLHWRLARLQKQLTSVERLLGVAR